MNAHDLCGNPAVDADRQAAQTAARARAERTELLLVCGLVAATAAQIALLAWFWLG